MLRLAFVVPLCCLAGCSSRSDAPNVLASTSAASVDEDKSPPKPDTLEQLVAKDAVAFLEASIARYDREVTGYRALLVKQERVAGKLRDAEHVNVSCLENPFSVRMEWQKGPSLAARTVYVKGRNNDQMLVKPAGWRSLVGIIQRDPLHPDARESSRYPITEFGIRIGMHKTLTTWQAVRAKGELQIVFGGIKQIDELAGRPCWELKRIGYKVPEKDGILEETFYFDCENGMQIGTYITGEEKKLIGQYYFQNVELNPKFDDDTFTREGLRR